MGFPIRKSPDHSLLAASRSLSQLIASFFACLRQGIHTHALSSLTIKSTSHTQRLPPSSSDVRYFLSRLLTCAPVIIARFRRSRHHHRHSNARQYSVVKDLDCFSNQFNPKVQQIADFLVGLGRLELPTSPLSGVRSSHLSYRPGGYKIARPFPEPKISPSVVSPRSSAKPIA